MQAAAVAHACSKAPPSRRPFSSSPVAYARAARYLAGSIALGSFIVACIQFIRFALEYIDRKTKKMQEGNVAAKWLMWCCKCIMWCLEKVRLD